MIVKLLKVSLLTLVAYLLQATLALHVALWGVAPNLALALVAVVTVGMGRKYAFFMSLIIGYLLEIMLPVLDYISLILYPVCAMLGALAFSDKSERKLEEELSMGKRSLALSPHIRTPLCAAFSVAVFESVNLIYIYLNGVTIDGGHLLRAFIGVAYSSLLAGILQFPIRWWLGVYKLKKARRSLGA